MSLRSGSLSRAAFLRVALGGVVTMFLDPRVAQGSVAPEPLPRRYRFVGGRAQRAAVVAAVEAATAEMNPLVRGIARSRIGSAVEPRATLEFDLGPDQVVFRSPGMPLLQAPLDRAIDWTNSEGAAVRVHCRREGQVLHIRYQGDGGDTRMAYRFDDDGDRLELRARIDHERLPATLRYGLSYRRD